MVYNYARFDAPALLKVLRSYRVTTLCTPPTVWRMLITADLSGGPGALREIIGAGEPGRRGAQRRGDGRRFLPHR